MSAQLDHFPHFQDAADALIKHELLSPGRRTPQTGENLEKYV